MPTQVGVKVLSMCTVESAEFTSICFWIEL